MMAPTELLAEQHERIAAAARWRRAATRRRCASRCSRRRCRARDAKRDRAPRSPRARSISSSARTRWCRRTCASRRSALAVIDEQHRFGVLQRQALAGKGPGERSPHVLVMTATPIPRTLALTLSGELDVSVLDELPPGRTPIATDVLREGEGARVVDAIRATLARGEQVYVVYPLVEESEQIGPARRDRDVAAHRARLSRGARRPRARPPRRRRSAPRRWRASSAARRRSSSAPP